MGYNFTTIEKKWQDFWLENKTFAALDPDDAGDMPKAYILDMFPYPSGNGLHVGHPEGYTATDILSRYLRMKGNNVLHPMGWDAFGLPAEQYAVKTNTHPRVTTEQNIANFRRQVQMLGLSYDWEREVDTTDPKYYRWTQWIFLQLYDSYFDPNDNCAKPIKKLINDLENENLVVAPDFSIRLNPTQEGMEAVGGEVRIERTWKELSPEERRDVIAANRLAYMDEAPVNWCPELGTVLANEEVVDGKSEVGGFPVERRPLRQWMLRITAYAQRLLDDLETLDWPESIKQMQRNWIGRSVGAQVDFELDRTSIPAEVAEDDEEHLFLSVFTTRPDTLYGATYMVIAPEHPLVDKITSGEHRDEVATYVAACISKSDRDRMAEGKEKTGAFTGAYAINPLSEERIPIYIADYVLMGYGTGAIMAVPAHDQRDYEFAQKFNLPINVVVKPAKGEAPEGAPFTEEGVAVNSKVIDGMPTQQAKETMIKHLQTENIGYGTVRFKLRDWLFSRQRYWGEPFPIMLDENGDPHAVDEETLPVELPEMDDFKPTGTPEPPLSKATTWLDYHAPGGKHMTRETNTMPQWAGSCWYYLRYIDPHNEERFVDPKLEKYWMPVDLYVGGVEHAVLHLLYSRFWHKVLFDLGHVSTAEPFQRLVNQGLILGEMEYHAFATDDGAPVSSAELKDITEEASSDGVYLVGTHKQSGDKVKGNRITEAQVEKRGDSYVLKDQPDIRVDGRAFKMSKSRGNVVNPDEIVRDYGADALRLYEMYLGPLEASKPWSTRDIVGMTRFLNGAWRNIVGDDDVEGAPKVADDEPTDDLNRLLHRTIKKVGEDIEKLSFNTAIAELIKLNNELSKQKQIPRKVAEPFVLLLAPFAPHLAEELWSRMGHLTSLARRHWPKYDESLLVESTLEIPVQVNGKLRDKITVPADATEQQVLEAAAASEKVASHLAGTIRKKLYVPGKMVNFVVTP